MPMIETSTHLIQNVLSVTLVLMKILFPGENKVLSFRPLIKQQNWV